MDQNYSGRLQRDRVPQKAAQKMTIKGTIKRTIARLLGRNIVMSAFHSDRYLRHNQRRLEHLASLRLAICGSTVLEVGAGIGDHTSFFLDRGCRVVSTEARTSNLKVLRRRYSNLDVRFLDLDNPGEIGEILDIVYCYGLLYHLKKPATAIAFMADHCRKMLLLETCVSYGDQPLLNPVKEDAGSPSQSVAGMGCRPTRKWVYDHLKEHFEFVYMPLTQPCHDEFPLDWSTPATTTSSLTRAVFIASRQKLANVLLVEDIPLQQRWE
jgi:SAM-dependent methyltransferase